MTMTVYNKEDDWYFYNDDSITYHNVNYKIKYI